MQHGFELQLVGLGLVVVVLSHEAVAISVHYDEAIHHRNEDIHLELPLPANTGTDYT